MANTIETAPRDGTPILVWHDWNGERYWVFAKWIDGIWYGDNSANKTNNPIHVEGVDDDKDFIWIPQPPPPVIE